MSHYDHIPAGKKPIRDSQTGEWKLVDMKEDDPKDLKILLDEERAKTKCLESEKEKLIELLKISDDESMKRFIELLELDKKEFDKFVKNIKK